MPGTDHLGPRAARGGGDILAHNLAGLAVQVGRSLGPRAPGLGQRGLHGSTQSRGVHLQPVQGGARRGGAHRGFFGQQAQQDVARQDGGMPQAPRLDLRGP